MTSLYLVRAVQEVKVGVSFSTEPGKKSQAVPKAQLLNLIQPEI